MYRARRDRLDTLAAGIRDQGGPALVLESDITDEQQATDAVARTVAELGRLDTLINNAGVMLLGPVVGAPLPEWQQMVELNVLGKLYCAHAALPHLLRPPGTARARCADMVNISSMAARAARNGNRAGAAAQRWQVPQNADSICPRPLRESCTTDPAAERCGRALRDDG